MMLVAVQAPRIPAPGEEAGALFPARAASLPCGCTYPSAARHYMAASLRRRGRLRISETMKSGVRDWLPDLGKLHVRSGKVSRDRGPKTRPVPAASSADVLRDRAASGHGAPLLAAAPASRHPVLGYTRAIRDITVSSPRAAASEELPMTDLQPLTGPEQKVADAAGAGELADLHADAREHSYARASDRNDGREVRASLVIELLTAGPAGGGQPSRAVRLCGASITGTLDLEGRTLACPLLLERCWLDEPASLDDAVAGMIRFSDCHVPGLSARRLRTTGNLELWDGFTSTAGVDLTNARIGGQVVLNNAHLIAPPFPHPKSGLGALVADGLNVEGNLLARGTFTVEGQARLLGARIGGALDFRGANLSAPGEVALLADHLVVGQDMGLEGATISGQVILRGARIGGQLVLNGARLAGGPRGKEVLDAFHLAVGQEMACSEGFTAEGEILLAFATIGGHLTFAGASLANPGARALEADWLTVTGSMICGERFTATGEVRLSAARIGGQLIFLGARLDNPGGTALSADRTEVGHNLALINGFSSTGEVSLAGARIGTHLNLEDAHLANPGGTALNAAGITVTAGVRGRKGFTADGTVSFRSASIDGTLDLTSARLSRPGGTALDLRSARVADLDLRPAQAPEGTVDLAAARIGSLTDDPATWPTALDLRGCTYDTLADGQATVRQRLDWLALSPGGYTPQVYDQLAGCYRRAGRDEAARRVAIAKQRRRRAALSPLSWLLYATIGYGYRTWLAAIWLAALTAAATPAFSYAYSHRMIRPAPSAPAFHSLAYTLDTLVPVISLGEKAAWTPLGWALYLSWGLIAAGWMLTTAAVAGLAGIFSRN
jgi:hypothetical protein